MCIFHTKMLDNPWVIVSDPTRQSCYQPVEGSTYWTVLCIFHDYNSIQFTDKTTTSEEIDSVHKVVLDGISDNMSALVQNGKHSAINTEDPTTVSNYVVKILS